MNYISLCFDKNYLHHVKTLIKSIIYNNKDLQITFCLFFGWNEKELKKSNIEEYVKNLWKEVKYWILDESVASNLKSCSYLWKATYYRLYIPKLLLESKIDKTLYIDCDVVNNWKINDLFWVDIDNKYFAVCLENSDKYTFNAWVMLINCIEWEWDNLSEKLIKFIEDNPDKIQVWDQSALNLAVDKWSYLILSPRYNLTIQYWYYVKYVYTKKQIKEEKRNAIFIHFNGRQKPRDYFCEHPLFKIRYTYEENPDYEIYLLNSLLHKFWIRKLKRFISSGVKILGSLVKKN